MSLTADSSVHEDTAPAETAEVVAELTRRVDELSQELLDAYRREEILIKQVDALQTRQQQTTQEPVTDAALQRKLESVEAQNADLRFELSSVRVAAAAAHAELRSLHQGTSSTSANSKNDQSSQSDVSALRRRYRQLRRKVARVVRPS
ncbi:hypothetical protein [Citricoccus muralis]|uniref:Uncharacterized protein n=1 Tax=Citricoccus muralis TaxID=169134 RepID=A0ABY8H6R1_9MICC|nr:hypothetical protein [Citricoccus muralis]WFP16711.1 hypothetical protein P8192_00865 [Citricoccus muralis]